MHRRILIVSAVGLALVTGISMIAVASVSDKRPIRQPVTLRFQSKNTASDFIDNDPSGQSLGDELLSVNVLTSDGHNAGRLNAVCTLMTKQALCHAIVRIHAGQLVLDGQIPWTWFSGSQDSPAKLAITGGTSAYRHAHGFAELKPGSEDGPLFVLHVTP